MRKELLQQLARGRGGVKQWAGLAIGVLERALADAGRTVNTDSTTALRSEVKDAKSSLDIGAFSIGAGVMGDLEAKEVLLAKLDTTRDPPARGFVAVSLGLLGAREAVEPIQEVVKSSKFQPDLLKSAAIGLGLLGDKNLALTLSAAVAIGILARYGPGQSRADLVRTTVRAGVVEAGEIILVIAAGGALGAVLRQAGMAELAAATVPAQRILLLPIAWGVTALVRIAQGSATVAMITADRLMS